MTFRYLNWEGYIDLYQLHRACQKIPNSQRATVFEDLKPIDLETHESILNFLHLDLVRLHNLSPLSFFTEQHLVHSFANEHITPFRK